MLIQHLLLHINSFRFSYSTYFNSCQVNIKTLFEVSSKKRTLNLFWFEHSSAKKFAQCTNSASDFCVPFVEGKI